MYLVCAAKKNRCHGNKKTASIITIVAYQESLSGPKVKLLTVALGACSRLWYLNLAMRLFPSGFIISPPPPGQKQVGGRKRESRGRPAVREERKEEEEKTFFVGLLRATSVVTDQRTAVTDQDLKKKKIRNPTRQSREVLKFRKHRVINLEDFTEEGKTESRAPNELTQIDVEQKKTTKPRKIFHFQHCWDLEDRSVWVCLLGPKSGQGGTKIVN